MIRRTYTDDDGRQYLVMTWLYNGHLVQQVATRREAHHTWGPPLELVATDDDTDQTWGLEMP